MKTRKKLIFHGDVQGVGFRYRAFYIAKSLRLVGYVYNKWDGTVEMEAEGEEASIKTLISRLETAPFIRITSVDEETIPLQNERSFKVLE